MSCVRTLAPVKNTITCRNPSQTTLPGIITVYHEGDNKFMIFAETKVA